MQVPDELDNLLSSPVEEFGDMERVRIVSHYDADGISAASIILACSLRAGKKPHLSIVEQIRPRVVEKLNEENPKNVIFTDLGSGHLSLVNKINSERTIVLDHHHIEGELEESLHVNPHLAGLEENSVSGAGITYLFARKLSEENRDLSPLAVVGAIGDIQEENWEMGGLNKELLEEAKDLGLLEIRKGLRLFGRLSRPIHKSLQYATRPYIPGISENESGSIQFLSELDIDPKREDGSWKKLSDLEREEKKRLASAIIKERINEGMEEAGEVFGNVYTLKNFQGRFKDARELSTALNACGRMSQSTVGVMACLGSSSARKKLDQIVEGYKKTLGKLVEKARKSQIIDKGKDMVVLDGIGKIPENFIGTVCSIVQPTVSEDKILVGLAESENDEIKVSLRAPRKSEINVGDLLGNISESMGGEGGGHDKAGGAYVEKAKKDKFIEKLEESIGNKKSI